MKKLFSVLILIAMLACMLPMAVSAATEGQVPIAKKSDGTVLSGAATEPHLKSWTISDTELYLDQGKDQGYFIFNDTMKEGRLEATLVKNKSNNSCDGIVFGLSDNDNMNFWEAGVSFYWLHIDEGVRLRLTRVGDGANYANGTWYDLIQGADQVDLDDTKGMNVEEGITIAAEWDGKGNIKCYANDELIYTYDDTASPFTGSRYGVRMKEKAAFGSTFTSIVAGYPVEGGDPTDPPVDPPVTGDPLDPPATDDPVDPPATEDPVDPPATDDPVDPPATEDPVDPPVTDAPTNPPVTDGPTNPDTSVSISDEDLIKDGTDAADDEGGFPVIPVVIGAAAVVVIAAVIVIVLKKRK